MNLLTVSFFNNSFVRIQDRPFVWDDWYEAGIFAFVHIFHPVRGTWLNFAELKHKFDIPESWWFQYKCLLSAIPRQILSRLADGDETGAIDEPPQNCTRLVYRELCGKTHTRVMKNSQKKLDKIL